MRRSALIRVSGRTPFHCAEADAEAAGWHELFQDGSADRSDGADHSVGDDARGLDDLIAGASERDAETAPVRVRPGVVPVEKPGQAGRSFRRVRNASAACRGRSRRWTGA